MICANAYTNWTIEVFRWRRGKAVGDVVISECYFIVKKENVKV